MYRNSGNGNNSGKGFSGLGGIFERQPDASAKISGSGRYARIQGDARFYQTSFGVLVIVDIEGLPTARGRCDSPIFALHIHEGEHCTGTEQDPFANALSHYNPHGCAHPYHAGDLPPLFGAGGYGFSAFLTDRFTAREVIGRTIILHAMPDDFMTQPAGNSGMKIACGEIVG